ncbi:hypothetical protein CLU79DRAFT_724457 [Phycomyces nitens]|nr:hypothetical protein CLU79DRAFT_724457 [Phycomyces nitens]
MCKPKRRRYTNNSMISVRSLYILKSKGAKDHEIRIKLLNLMCRRLKERSLVDHVFVSYNSQANDPLAERDMKQKDELLTQLSVEGNTQDMLAYITNTERICLVALDYTPAYQQTSMTCTDS